MTQLTIVGKVVMAGKVKCYYLPLVKLTKFLSTLQKGQAVQVRLDTKRFDIKPIEALARSYGASIRVVRRVDGMIDLLVYKGEGDEEGGLSDSG